MSVSFLTGLVLMHRSMGRPSAPRSSISALVATSKPQPLAATARNTAGWGDVFTA